MPTPQAFLFDIGNVLFTFDYPAMLHQLAGRAGGEPLPFEAFDALRDRYETGALSDAEFVDAVRSAVRFDGSAAEFIEIWTGIFTANEPMLSAVERLAARGHPLYLLSNTNGLHLSYLRDAHPAMAHFAGGSYSHEVGTAKPGAAIYEHATTTFDLDPNQTLYIDDLPANIESGRRHGLRSHLYAHDAHAGFCRWLLASGIDLND